MSFLSGLGEKVGGFARGVSKVAGFVSKITKFLMTPLEQLLAPVKKMVGDAVEKIPFVGKLVRPFVEKFFDHALSFLAAGPLGGLGFLAKAMPTIEKLADLAATVGKAADSVADVLQPQAKENVANVIAESQAGLLE